MDGEPGDDMNNVTPLRGYAAFRAGETEQSDLFGTAASLWSDGATWSEQDIPVRPWIAPGYLMRGAVTVLSGPGSAGKSMLTLLWCVSIALERRIGRFFPAPGLRALVYNVEDDADEQKRRLSSALRQNKAHPSDLVGRVMRAGPTGVGTLFRVDPLTKRLTGTEILARLEQLLEEFKPDVAFLDPMVELHDSEENDNTAIRAFMAKLRALAARYNCAICLLHHARKGAAGTAGDPDSLRGASAIVGAARVVLTVLTMDEDEAKGLNIAADVRRNYFRLDGAKSNYAAVQDAEWFERVPHTLMNGDVVPAASPWTPPSIWAEVTDADCNRALDIIAAGPTGGGLFSAHKRGRVNDRWVGKVLVDQFGVPEEQAAAMIKIWLKNGLLVEKEFRDPIKRVDRVGVVVCDAKRPER